MISKSWFLALLALVLTLGTQAVSFMLFKDELFPNAKEILVVKREDPSPIVWSFSSDDLERLKIELLNRLSDVERREAELASYEAQLASDREEIEAIKKDVENMRDTLLSDVVEVEDWERRNLKTLADTYSNLEPTATVSIFEELDDATVAKIMRFMKPDTIGEILQEMAMQGGGNEALIKRAARLSDLLRVSKDENAT